MASSAELEKFNKEGVLTNLLSIEEHLVGSNNIGNHNQWCGRKHFLLGSGHHAFELQQLTSDKDPKLSKKIGEFRKKWAGIMDNKPTSAKIRDLRNEWREIIKDDTLKTKCGTVCQLDRLSSHGSHVETEDENPSEEESGGNGVLIVGGIVVGVLALYLLNRRA